MSDVTQLGDIVVRGQRRAPGAPGGYGGGGSGGGSGGYDEMETLDPGNPEAPDFYVDPCSNPLTRLDWNLDAAAGEAVRAMAAYAAANFPGTGFEKREFGAALWLMPNGRVVAGPVEHSEHEFGSGNLVGVSLDMTPPDSYAIYMGSVHSHNSGGYLPSGNNQQPYTGDQQTLYDNRTYLVAAGHSPNNARIYIVAYDPGRGGNVIHVYTHENMTAAIGGQLGPEVDPEGVQCPPT